MTFQSLDDDRLNKLFKTSQYQPSQTNEKFKEKKSFKMY